MLQNKLPKLHLTNLWARLAIAVFAVVCAGLFTLHSASTNTQIQVPHAVKHNLNLGMLDFANLNSITLPSASKPARTLPSVNLQKVGLTEFAAPPMEVELPKAAKLTEYSSQEHAVSKTVLARKVTFSKPYTFVADELPKVHSTGGLQLRFSTSNVVGVVSDDQLNKNLSNLLTKETIALRKVGYERMRVISTPLDSSLRPKVRGDIRVLPKIEYTRKWLSSQPVASGGAQWACLREALYFEARGESIKGQVAVAEVILNRVESRKFPNSICGVVNQGTGKRHQCQFSYACDGKPEVVNEPAAHRNVGKIARALMDGAPRNLTLGATYYHNHTVSPGWSRVFIRTASVDGHLFYR